MKLISLPLVSALYSGFALPEEHGMQALGTLGSGKQVEAQAVNADGSVVVGYADNVKGNQENQRAFRWTANDNKMQDLGILGGSEQAWAQAVNADGNVVVGTASNNSEGKKRAFRWTARDNKMQDLGILKGSEQARAWAVNANGNIVVGTASNAEGKERRAFRWTVSDNKMQDLGILKGREQASALAVNADGSVVVGISASNADKNRRAFRWTANDNKMQDLDTLGGEESQAWDVSADGSVVVGSAINAEENWHAFRWTANGNKMQDLGTLGGKQATARAVSADGSVVVGSAINAEENWHAYRWTASDNKMQDLGTLGGQASQAWGVNADGGVVVGKADNAEGKKRAFRWTARDQMQDLGTLGGPSSQAWGVSADGNIVVGEADNAEGKKRAFIWKRNPRSVEAVEDSPSSTEGAVLEKPSSGEKKPRSMAENPPSSATSAVLETPPLSATNAILETPPSSTTSTVLETPLSSTISTVFLETPPSGATDVASTAPEALTAPGTMLDVANTRAGLGETVNQQWQALALNDARLAGLLDRRCVPTSNTWCINGGVSGRKGPDRQGISASLSLARQLVPGWYVGAGIDERLDASALQHVRTTTSVPTLALYTGWNQHPEGTGWHIAAGAGYVRDGAEIVRDYYENTEYGKGHTQLSGKTFRLRGSYGFQLSPTLQITPYEELRYTAADRGHYCETGTAFNTCYDAMTSRRHTLQSGVNITAQLNDRFSVSARGGVDVDLLSEKEGGEAKMDYLGTVSVPVRSSGRVNPFGEVGVTYSFSQGTTLSLVGSVHNNAINKQSSEATLSISKVW